MGTREADLDRRALLGGMTAASMTAGGDVFAAAPRPDGQPVVRTGAMVAAADGFRLFAGRRIGLVTNHTGLVHTGLVQSGRAGPDHLVDLMAANHRLKVTAVLAPEHGFRGRAEAGAKVADGRDAKTGLPIFSLYGATRKPTTAMLADIDVLVFDIQDIGARFYTYISTMGLAMQAAAERGIPFVVLDRPNPLGGHDVSGFVLEPRLASFVGRYPIPIVHGMTVGELAVMIRGENWLDGVGRVDLSVVRCTGLTRAMRFPATRLPWIATSPNIPTFEAALAYPGIGIVGETLVNEGRGTPTPFTLFGAPWVDAERLAAELAAARLPGVRFKSERYVPVAIPDVAAESRFRGEEVRGVRVVVDDVASYRPLDVGIHALALLAADARRAGAPLLPEKRGMFHAIAGTERLARQVAAGANGADIVASWQTEVARFLARRQPYLSY